MDTSSVTWQAQKYAFTQRFNDETDVTDGATSDNQWHVSDVTDELAWRYYI